MIRTSLALVAAWALAGCAAIPQARDTPRVDHHQHLFSPALVAMLGPGAGIPVLTAAELLPLMDAAGIDSAAVLSTGYLFSAAGRVVEDEYARVRADNDWTRDQAGLAPSRLRSFCGVNPLKDYALRELERCAADQRQGRGIKMHLGNADVQLDLPGHRDKLREFFAASNRLGMGLVVHARANIRLKRPYGAAQARAFLELLEAAPDVPVIVAHFAGSGPGYQDPPAHEVMAVLAEAVARGDPRTRNLWFDVASIAHPSMSQAQREAFASRIRRVGVDRVLYGSDSAVGNNLRPREAWAAFRELPLRPDELARIAGNVAPTMRFP